MFNLERAIVDWRQKMLAGGLRTREVLDELESHLRDDVEQHIRSGLNEADSFEAATLRIGEVAVLQTEFDKVGALKESPEAVKRAILRLAGIPSHELAASMNAPYSNVDPWWTTYFKGGAFLVPAVCLWSLAAVFLVPKLQQICADVGFAGLAEASVLWRATRSAIMITELFREHGFLLSVGIIGILLLLEWRSREWPRYRRAVIGSGAFLVNFVVLFSMFIMFLATLVAAPGLIHHAR